MARLTTNGLDVSGHFPHAAYEAVSLKVRSRWQSHPQYEHFSGAWNALSYRFEGTLSAGDDFVHSLKSDGPTPPPAERYKQEHALFSFFSSGFSAVESLFYGLYAIGSFIDTSHFSLATAKDQQKVSPKTTIDAFKTAFPDDPILSTFSGVTTDAAYLQWREIRNILTHRSAPECAWETKARSIHHGC